MTAYERAEQGLRRTPRRWLVTGCAGFIGSNLLERLLSLGQEVVGLDNFATGFRGNLDEVRRAVGREAWSRFRLMRGDLREPGDCRAACAGVEVVLHHGALGSVPRSFADPSATHAVNAGGTLNLLIAARAAGVSRFVFASSSSVYGDDPGLPKVEDRLGAPLSPYAASKRAAELYALAFHRAHGLPAVGLRYFNVFGRRQNPAGDYAAVIPRWIARMIAGEPCVIHGDGKTTRDFCYVENVVRANLLAAAAPREDVAGEIFNVACGERTELRRLYELIRAGVESRIPGHAVPDPEFLPFRAGDVRHTLADISRVRARLGYVPEFTVERGLAEALPWYLHRAAAPAAM